MTAVLIRECLYSRTQSWRLLIPRIAELTQYGWLYNYGRSCYTPGGFDGKQVEYLNDLDGTATDQENQMLEAYKAMRITLKP